MEYWWYWWGRSKGSLGCWSLSVVLSGCYMAYAFIKINRYILTVYGLNCQYFILYLKLIRNLMGWSSWHLNTVINLKITKQRATWYLCLLPNEGKLISYLHPKKKIVWNSGANFQFTENTGLESNMLNNSETQSVKTMQNMELYTGKLTYFFPK